METANTSSGLQSPSPTRSIHSLKPYAMTVVDTPPFQRLRSLSQLGVTHFVFPGATHTRFEHSLGVAYKVGRRDV